jgi:predicted AAA+ superfamily ATPase
LLIQALAVNNGAETKTNSLSQMAGIDEKTVKNYIELLKETILTIIQPMNLKKHALFIYVKLIR